MSATGKDIKEAFERLTRGVEIECTRNDKIPERVGLRGYITKPGRTSIRIEVSREPFKQLDHQKFLVGQSIWLYPPSKVSEFDHASSAGIGYVKDGYTVEWAVSS